MFTVSCIYSSRQRVEEITAAPRGWDKETRVISQLTTFSSGSRIRTEWTPQVTRRSTEINVNAVEEISRSAQLGAHGENENKYSQTPSVSSLSIINMWMIIVMPSFHWTVL